MDVAILGCGPAGLLAAHAAVQNGNDIRIFSRKIKSDLYGAQYLHEPITGITGMPEEVSYKLVGTPEEYRSKVYGEEWDGTVSPEDLDEDHMAWDIRQAYDALWERYADLIWPMDILSHEQLVQATAGAINRFDIVLSTIPRKVFAQPGDVFESMDIWALGDAPDKGIQTPIAPGSNNTVICDGTDSVGWYRISRVFDYATMEWPGWRSKPPIRGIAKVTKPLRCHVYDDHGFHYLGRYGKWEKGVLTTDAYNEALRLTSEK